MQYLISPEEYPLPNSRLDGFKKLKEEFNDLPQDIEWAIDASGQIWVLQSRDLYLGK